MIDWSYVVYKLTDQMIDDMPLDTKEHNSLIQSRSNNVSVTEDLIKLIVCYLTNGSMSVTKTCTNGQSFGWVSYKVGTILFIL